MKRGAALVLLAALAACTAPMSAPPPAAGTSGIAFALIGDTPYSAAEASALDVMIDRINREDLAFVIHVGDVTSGRGPCTDEWFEARKRQFDRSRHPFVIVPGDNDWVDCHRSGFDPIERLGKFREIFESGDTSLGRRRMPLERQSGRFAAYREHLRWVAGNVLFLGLNVQGSDNNVGRSSAMDVEARDRMAAVAAWLEDGVRDALERKLSGMVIFAQADPEFGGRRKKGPDVYAGFREMLLNAAQRLGRPVLFVNGDAHVYRLDRPLADPASGVPLRNFTRVVVYGSPFTRWIRAGIDPVSGQLFWIDPAPEDAGSP